MNVWEYLDRNNHTDTVVNALNKLRITPELHAKTMLALTRYQFIINYRAKSRFGCVKHTKQRLEVTSEYFVRGYTLREDRADDHNQTLLHEVAHIITHVIRPAASAHGDDWKAVMRALGAKANRCGSASFLAEVRKAKQPNGKKHQYNCDKCDYVYRCNRKLKNLHQRHHANCGGGFIHTQLR